MPHSRSIFYRSTFCAAALLIGLNSAQAIVGGTPSPTAEGPMLMVLSNRGSVCSGVVISRDAVLTAAHCVTGASAYRLHWRDASGQPVMEAPKRITLHPDYRPDAIASRKPSVDLALIQSQGPLPAQFTPAPLPDAKQPPSPKDSLLTVRGYGLTSESKPDSIGQLRDIRLPVVTPYGQGRLLIWLQGQGQQGACTGDSGGGIFDPQGRLHAITVWTEGPKTASGQSHCGSMTQGVLVAPQRNWIDTILKR